jgi:hypothetical protein
MDILKEKKALLSSLTGLVGVIIIVLLYVMFWGVLQPQEQYPVRNISVSASGKTTAKPDVALVSFSVVSEGKDTKVISDQNNEKINKAISFLKDQGIDEKDIKTTEYNITPVYSQQAISPLVVSTGSAPLISVPSRQPTTFVPSIVKYSITQTVQAKIRDFSKISEVVGALAPMGINKINGISFSIDDPEAARTIARADAIVKAKAKAESMAQQLEVSLGDAVSISEYAQNDGVYQPMMSKVVSGYGGESAPLAPTIEAGSQDVVVNVNVTYKIK